MFVRKVGMVVNETAEKATDSKGGGGERERGREIHERWG